MVGLTYSPQIKAAIKYDLEVGRTNSEIVERHQVSKTLVYRYRKHWEEWGEVSSQPISQGGRVRALDLAVSMALLDYLEGGFFGWGGGFLALGGMLTVYYRKESRKVLYKRLYRRRGRLHSSVAPARWTTAMPAHFGGSHIKFWWGDDRGPASAQNLVVLQEAVL